MLIGYLLGEGKILFFYEQLEMKIRLTLTGKKLSFDL
jgi:hypothetical protein